MQVMWRHGSTLIVATEGSLFHVGDRTSARDLNYEKVFHNEQNHLGWVGEHDVPFPRKDPKQKVGKRLNTSW